MTQMSTNLKFDQALSRLSVTQDRVSRTQMQLTEGKQVLKPSDAPDQSAQITRLKSAIDRQNSYVDTIKLVRDKLGQQETALDGATEVMTRLKELTVQAANGTYGATDRKAIGIEVRELRDQLLSLANTQDVNGNTIFSGTRVGQLAFAADSGGRVVYQGDQTVTSAGIADQSAVDSSRPGSRPFDKLVRIDETGKPYAVGFFEAIDDLVVALDRNDIQSVQRAVGETTTMQQGLSDSLAAIGAAGNKLENQQAIAEENLLRMKSLLSDAEDIDMTKAISQMQKDMLALQAGQTTFAKIAEMTLFNYIR
ncbi:MAG: flagellar hook-associated protein FlgL [Burkholderiaceae bacterium]|jgi:flagellar hook-associated protein 3 FlgL|nr:flagellar hook-associated protein FlgL [Burkholderiaceae bacterium]